MIDLWIHIETFDCKKSCVISVDSTKEAISIIRNSIAIVVKDARKRKVEYKVIEFPTTPNSRVVWSSWHTYKNDECNDLFSISITHLCGKPIHLNTKIVKDRSRSIWT